MEVTETKGNLPHWAQKKKIYFVTFRLADSLPQYVLRDYQLFCQLRENAIKICGEAPEEWRKYGKERHNRMLQYLDAGHGECVLKKKETRYIVQKSLSFVDGQKCFLHAYVIMPNHVHLLIEMPNNNSVTKLVGDVKKYTASEINKLLGRTGMLWQRECYDRIVRSVRHYMKAAQYIVRNPRCCRSSEYTLYVSEKLKELLEME